MTTKRLTAEDLAVIKARANAATGGEWVSEADNTDPNDPCSMVVLRERRGVCVASILTLRDSLFIAAARTDVPDLIAEVRALTAERDELRAIIAGRKVAPTDAEVAAHERKHGLSAAWLSRWEGRPRTIENSGGVRYVRGTGGAPWWPLDANGRPCAWPTVTP